MPLVSKKDSIYFQLLRLLLISGVISVVFFTIANDISTYVIWNYYDNSDYEEKKDKEYLDKLQTYINENEVSTKD